MPLGSGQGNPGFRALRSHDTLWAMEIVTRKSTNRWWVHLGLISTAIVSLAFEPILTLHIVFGLVFAVLVGVHLVQRRRITGKLASRLLRLRTLNRPLGRLAVADALLVTVTLAMLVSGFWAWSLGHPTRIRWHALSGLVLSGFLMVHTLRRRKRLHSSQVR
jgi:hypothetical protein